MTTQQVGDRPDKRGKAHGSGPDFTRLLLHLPRCWIKPATGSISSKCAARSFARLTSSPSHERALLGTTPTGPEPTGSGLCLIDKFFFLPALIGEPLPGDGIIRSHSTARTSIGRLFLYPVDAYSSFGSIGVEK
jgi:hypothetical protein